MTWLNNSYAFDMTCHNIYKGLTNLQIHIGITSPTIRWFCNKLKFSPFFLSVYKKKTLNRINQTKGMFAGNNLKIAPLIILKCTSSMMCFLSLFKLKLFKRLELVLLILHSCRICPLNFIYLIT